MSSAAFRKEEVIMTQWQCQKNKHRSQKINILKTNK